MIPMAYILKWREYAPWNLEDQIEQDLILSRILVELFSEPLLYEELAFRGGTALNKLYINPPVRYSEDIDLVRVKTGPIGNIIHTIRNKLDAWLGKPATKRNHGRFTLLYNFIAEATATKMKVKIEINTREHTPLFDLCPKDFYVNNVWFSGKTSIQTYVLEELMGTKLRAFYQRKKARDLFDLYWILKSFDNLNINKILESFNHYLLQQNLKISRAEFEKNLYEKLQNKVFINDLNPLLNIESLEHSFDLTKASTNIYHTFIKKLPGEPWKKQDKLLDLFEAN